MLVGVRCYPHKLDRHRYIKDKIKRHEEGGYRKTGEGWYLMYMFLRGLMTGAD